MTSQSTTTFLRSILIEIGFDKSIAENFNLDEKKVAQFISSWSGSSTEKQSLQQSSSGIKLLKYKNSIIIVGDTKPIKEFLKNDLGGKWNSAVHDGSWVFPQTKKDSIVESLQKNKIKFSNELDSEVEVAVENNKPKTEVADKPTETVPKKKENIKSKPKELPEEKSKNEENKLVITAKNTSAHKVLKSYISKYGGDVDDNTYTFDASKCGKLTVYLEKYNAEYEIVEDKLKPVEKPTTTSKFVKNKWGEIWEPKSKIVFEKEEDGTMVAIGKQTNEDDTLYELDEKEIKYCEKHNWQYRVPTEDEDVDDVDSVHTQDDVTSGEESD